MSNIPYFVFVPTLDPDQGRLNEEVVRVVARDTGLDVATLRNSLLGNGIGCVRRSSDRTQMEPVAEGLALHRVPFLYIRLPDLLQVPVHESRKMVLTDDGVVFETEAGDVVLRYDEPLILASSESFAADNITGSVMKSERFVLAARGRAVIFQPSAMVVEGLEEDNPYSRIANVIGMVEELFRRANRISVDRSFASLKMLLNSRFAVYAALLSVWIREGLTRATLPSRLVVAGESTDQLSPGPTIPHHVYTGVDLWRYRYRRLQHRVVHDRGTSLLAAVVFLVYGSFRLNSTILFLLAMLLMGTVSVFKWWRLLRLKYLVEDLPTSKLRSVAAGLVEVYGRIHADRSFVSPISGARCVCFRYEKQRWVRRGRHAAWQTVEIGEAFPDLAYLDDGTGIISLNLKNAELLLTNRYQTNHTYVNVLAGVSPAGESKVRYVEEYLQEGQSVYVMGTAVPVNPILLFGQYLSTVKKNRDAMARFDLNGDGVIDDREWADAVPKLRQEFLARIHKKGQSFGLILDRHPDTPVFLVSNEKESRLVGRLKWRIPLYFAMGVVSVVLCLISIFHLTGG